MIKMFSRACDSALRVCKGASDSLRMFDVGRASVLCEFDLPYNPVPNDLHQTS